MDFQHTSILLEECMENLKIKLDGIYVDGTMGGAGHSSAIASKLGDRGRLICFDQDADAIEVGKERLSSFGNKITIIHENFKNIKKSLLSIGIEKIDGVLLDLGVSSYQLDEGSRGFSYQHDARLDMRMDRRVGFSAYDVVNDYSERELSRIFYEYGEEKWSKRIAQFIVEHRKEKPIETTGELVEIIKKAIPAKVRQEGPHPAKRTFQAIRIEVNNELGIIRNTIEEIASILHSDGRICIITFHSLEDRLVKQTFKELENPCTCPPSFPICVCNKTPQLKVITRKPIEPSKQEVEQNPRSRSAKLRVAEKL